MTTSSPLQVTRFRIDNLHGSHSFDIPIQDNRVVLVGVNGLGKTTVMNLFYALLSRQWARLLDYQFEAIAIDIAGESIRITHDEIESACDFRLHREGLMRAALPVHAVHEIARSPVLGRLMRESISANMPAQRRHAIVRLSGMLELPVSFLDRQIERLRRERALDVNLFEDAGNFRRLDDALMRFAIGQVLYLPTYRRIERDLKAIFPGLEEDVRKFNEKRSRAAASDYVELVEFGMEDVEEKLKSALAELRETSRSQLTGLAGSYLGDVIRGDAETPDVERLYEIEDVESILARVEEQTLTRENKKALRETLERLRSVPRESSASAPTGRDAYLAHFFLKLVDIHRALKEREQPIAQFVRVCNGYLEGKELVFDDRKYTIEVVLKRNGSVLELRRLSSGEKQIVSLFSHLYLATAGGNFAVLIDEPELSLSVEWQKRLLPDVLESGRCALLAAVTHSPYIFDNSLDPYARDLRSCLRVSP